MTQFILNNRDIQTGTAPGMTLLDFIRYENHLTGTKIGCREGDCGACSILIGEFDESGLRYSSATSCLMPLANAAGKHIVTIEGINKNELTACQEAFAAEGATQCGFCTPGFIVSLTGHCLDPQSGDPEAAIDSMNGNICRCTGYKSIQRAAHKIAGMLGKRGSEEALSYAISNNMVPEYFSEIPERLRRLRQQSSPQPSRFGTTTRIGGGTDLYVQRHDSIAGEDLNFLQDRKELKQIRIENNICRFGGAFTASDLEHSEVFRTAFPSLQKYVKLISSKPIRNMGTIAGNFINASPIGDFSIFFLALNATVVFNDSIRRREVPLRKMYQGYKVLDKSREETVEEIWFELPGKTDRFNFEKVSKRTHLDIASVNSAIHLQMNENEITNAGLSAGGVGPVPLFLERTSAFLIGKKVSASVILEAIEIAQSEISPISDARGTDAYKRLLLSQLIKAHFITLFPDMPVQMLLESHEKH